MSEASYEDSDLTPETTYTYQVRSVRGTETSVWTASVTATTDAFTAPGNFTATAASSTSVELTWDESPGTEVSYRIRQRVSGERRWQNATDVTGSSHTVTGLTADTTYQFRIYAHRRVSGGERERSPAVDAEARTQAQ